jgi:aldehyde dehydrogenase (NAD+)
MIQEQFEKIHQFKSTTALWTVEQRIGHLGVLEKTLIQYETAICQALHQDLGKSKEEALMTEILPVLSDIRLFKKQLKRWSRPRTVANSLPFIGNKAYLVPEAKGTCLIIAPWNYPFQLCLSPLVACIAGGNTAIVKPSEYAIETGKIIQAILQACFEDIFIQVVLGGQDVAEQLLNLPFDHIHFTGSPKVGRIVMAAAAQHLTSVTLELGGKSPVIVDQNSDLESVVRKIWWGKLMNMGQTCIAPDYVFVAKHQVEAFVTLSALYLKRVYQGNSSQFAHLIHTVHLNRLLALINDAKQHEVAFPIPFEVDVEAKRLSPTVALNPPEQSLLMQEEIFGPILPIVPYISLEEVVQKINAKPKPLALYVFSNRPEFIDYVSQRTSSGAVTVNETLVHVMHPNLPFGGVKHSGLGSATGKFGFEAFTHLKPVLQVNKRWSVSQLLPLPLSKNQKTLNIFKKLL